ncbi:MAG: hypothetical protein GEU83_06860 [Pseudonocardiaceae bacterium]|nr:hypothetical protein [Pseudonocardiaceae bacterium]
MARCSRCQYRAQRAQRVLDAASSWRIGPAGGQGGEVARAGGRQELARVGGGDRGVRVGQHRRGHRGGQGAVLV